jgi:hypothetical protein
MKEREELSQKTAEELQTDLVQIFTYLPKMEAVIPPHIDPNSLNQIEKVGYYYTLAKNEEKRARSELTEINSRLLNRLLANADITPMLRDAIVENFQICFIQGYNKQTDSDFFNLIGVEDSNLLPEGIFSNDKNVRMKIERGYHQSIIDDLQYFIGNPQESMRENIAEEIVSLGDQIYEYEIQFMNLYGESTMQAPVYPD